MPVWWGNNVFKWGWVMGFLQRAFSAACAGVLILPTGSALGQQGLTDAERVRALEQKIHTNGSRLDGTAGDYICSSNEGTTVISYREGGVTFEKQVGLYQGLPNWQKVADKGILTGNHTLYLTTDAISQGGIVSINPTYAVIPEGQEEPILSPERSTPVALHYIQPFQGMTPEERLKGMEAAVSEACKPKSEEPSYPVLQAFSGRSIFSM